jgi:hypothetical protein
MTNICVFVYKLGSFIMLPSAHAKKRIELLNIICKERFVVVVLFKFSTSQLNYLKL